MQRRFHLGLIQSQYGEQTDSSPTLTQATVHRRTAPACSGGIPSTMRVCSGGMTSNCCRANQPTNQTCFEIAGVVHIIPRDTSRHVNPHAGGSASQECRSHANTRTRSPLSPSPHSQTPRGIPCRCPEGQRRACQGPVLQACQLGWPASATARGWGRTANGSERTGGSAHGFALGVVRFAIKDIGRHLHPAFPPSFPCFAAAARPRSSFLRQLVPGASKLPEGGDGPPYPPGPRGPAPGCSCR